MLAVDIGGTTWSAQVFSQVEDYLIEKEYIESDTSDDPNQFIAKIKEFLPEINITKVGISFPGGIDSEGKVTSWPNNKNWNDFELKQELQSILNCEVQILDDGLCATIGEYDSKNDLLCVVFGTGVGSGIIKDGNLLNRDSSDPKTLGHFRIGTNKICVCNSKGCIQTELDSEFTKTLQSENLNPGEQTVLTKTTNVIYDLALMLGINTIVLTGGRMFHHREFTKLMVDLLETTSEDTKMRILVSSEPSKSSLKGAMKMISTYSQGGNKCH